MAYQFRPELFDDSGGGYIGSAVVWEAHPYIYSFGVKSMSIYIFEVRYTHLYIIQLLVTYKTQLKSILHFHTLNYHIFIEECVLVIKNIHGFV